MIQPQIKLTDIGINLTDSAFDKDRSDVINTARNAGVQRLIITGTTLKESKQAIQLCHESEGNMYCTVGVHPHYSKEFDQQIRSELMLLLAEPCVVAVGETGLDFNRNFSTPEEQVNAFTQQLEMSAESGLPVFLHERDAHSKQLELLRGFRDRLSGGVAHCFTGSKEELYNYLDLDLYIGITGWICDERRGTELLKLLKEIPDDRILLETDAPYLLPRDIRPKPKSRRNLPVYLPHILHTAATARDQSEQQLAQLSEENCERLFRF